MRPLRCCCLLLITFALIDKAAGQNRREAPMLALDTGGHTAFVSKVLFTPDGRQLITVSYDKTIRFWYVETGELLDVIRLPIGAGHDGSLRCAALSSDARFLAVGGYGAPPDPNAIYVILLTAADRTLKVLKGHASITDALAFSPDGKRLASASWDGTAAIWDVATGRTLFPLKAHTSHVVGIAFSPDGKRVATASYDKTAMIWSASTGKVERLLRGHEKEVECIAWSRDGKTLATGGKDGMVCIWSPEGVLRKSFKGLLGEIKSIVFTPDGRQVLITRFGGPGYKASLLTIADGKENVRFNGHSNTVLTGAVTRLLLPTCNRRPHQQGVSKRQPAGSSSTCCRRPHRQSSPV